MRQPGAYSLIDEIGYARQHYQVQKARRIFAAKNVSQCVAKVSPHRHQRPDELREVEGKSMTRRHVECDREVHRKSVCAGFRFEDNQPVGSEKKQHQTQAPIGGGSGHTRLGIWDRDAAINEAGAVNQNGQKNHEISDRIVNRYAGDKRNRECEDRHSREKKQDPVTLKEAVPKDCRCCNNQRDREDWRESNRIGGAQQCDTSDRNDIISSRDRED